MQTIEWYNLLDYWCNKKSPKGFGLTIPFLVGATTARDINELLTEIAKTETEKQVVLQFCHDIWEYVISLPNAPKDYFRNYKRLDQLAVNDDNLDELKSLDELVDHLGKRYNPMIADHKFSKNKITSEWEPFSEEEKLMIEENKK